MTAQRRAKIDRALTVTMWSCGFATAFLGLLVVLGVIPLGLA